MRLSQEESDSIAALSEEILYDIHDVRIDDYVYHCNSLGRRLPERLKRRLYDMKIRGEPYIVLEGLPMIKQINETPGIKKIISQAHNYYQNLISIISTQLGFLYRFCNKNDHGFIEDVFAIEAHKNKQMGSNSVFLDWHVEDAVHKAKADYISLLCLKSDPDVKTLLYPGKKLNETLPDTIRYELNQKKYLLKNDETFDSGCKFSLASFVLEDSKDPEFIFDPSFTEPMDEASKNALSTLTAHINQSPEVISLNKGDMLIFDNRRVVHSRTPYSPKYDGTDRWLLRTLIVESTWKLKDNVIHDNLTVN